MHGGVGGGQQSRELRGVRAGRPALLDVGLVPDLEVVDLAADVVHQRVIRPVQVASSAVGAGRLAGVLRVVQCPARHPGDLEADLEAGIVSST